jgi:maleylacetoacetate isomerase
MQIGGGETRAMRLYTQWRNSAGERVRIALHLKAIDYEYVAIPSLPPGEYRRLNPQGLMPALQVGDRIFAQATAILEYLEETHPRPALLPADPVLRAEVRSFAQLITSDLHPLNNNRVRKYLAGSLGADPEAIQRWYHHWLKTGLDALEATLGRRAQPWPFCFGDRPGWADLHLVPQLANARRFDFDLDGYPALLGIDARCRALEAFHRARPEAQPDFPGT